MSIITIPASPAAPESIEFTLRHPSAATQSPFTGATQVMDWGNSWMEATVSMPPLTPAQATNWIAFLNNLHGQANKFQFTAAFVAEYAWVTPGSLPLSTLYWKLKSASNKYSLTHQRVVGMSFEIVQDV